MLLKAGTRPSMLAFKQVDEIQGKLSEVMLQPFVIHTKGDKDKITPLTARENTDFFTYEIEEVLLKGEIDVAIHSAKDLERETPDGLLIAAETRSIDMHDCLVSNLGHTLFDLPEGAIIGTSSNNRKRGVLRCRDDLEVRDIRGNIDERLDQLHRGDFDALIVAKAALIRLEYGDKDAWTIPFSIIEPHYRQGSLAVQVRDDRKDLLGIFGEIDGK